MSQTFTWREPTLAEQEAHIRAVDKARGDVTTQPADAVHCRILLGIIDSLRSPAPSPAGGEGVSEEAWESDVRSEVDHMSPERWPNADDDMVNEIIARVGVPRALQLRVFSLIADARVLAARKAAR